MTSEKTIIPVVGYEMLEKKVVAQGTSGRVYVPKAWVGTRVRIIRIDEV